jgi:3D (Asp-Asp-Asp) domain-containing protein
MDNTSSIVVTGTTKVSKVTVEARSNSSTKELEIIAGSYTASHKFSTTVTSHTFEITDTSATGFSLKAAAKSVQVLSLRWE